MSLDYMFDIGNNIMPMLVAFLFYNTRLHRKQTQSMLQKTMRNFFCLLNY